MIPYPLSRRGDWRTDETISGAVTIEMGQPSTREGMTCLLLNTFKYFVAILTVEIP